MAEVQPIAPKKGCGDKLATLLPHHICSMMLGIDVEVLRQLHVRFCGTWRGQGRKLWG